MAGTVAARLAELGLTLPPAVAPVGNYVPATRAPGLLFISGQIPIADGQLPFRGRVGIELTIEQGQQAARLCALNILGAAAGALEGDLDRIVRCLKVEGFVACDASFHDHPSVINGASDLLVAVLGESGRHARFALGAPSLPRNVAVEVAATFAVRD